MKKWIGVDLDGTLARYDEWVSSTHIGPPIYSMVGRVKRWINEGEDVRIFTSRLGGFDINDPDKETSQEELKDIIEAIEMWCETYLDCVLPITNVKTYGMKELWDDRCIQVEENTGIPIIDIVKASYSLYGKRKYVEIEKGCATCSYGVDTRTQHIQEKIEKCIECTPYVYENWNPKKSGELQ